MARGELGEAKRMAIGILCDMGRILGAPHLIPVSSAHIDGCLYHGDSGVHFAERLVKAGAEVSIPTTLNVGALNLLKPRMSRLPEEKRNMARRLMRAYTDMKCQATWTCAPYQGGHRPGQGEDIAWAESNAVVFVNSVLGARTNRYGDFLDICAAITGRVPYYGLHVPENRLATIVIDTSAISESLKASSVFYPVLGAWLGRTVGANVAVIDGIPETVTEDQLKALGASAASTGAVGLFHVAGVTPEAKTLEEALGGRQPSCVIGLTSRMVRETLETLSTSTGDSLDAVALGSPHYSIEEFLEFETIRAGRKLSVPVYICTGRHTIEALQSQSMLPDLEAAGVTIVADTCVVVTPILDPKGGVLMTDSGKFANYTPSNTGYEVLYASLPECVESAVAGSVVRRPDQRN